MGGQPAAFGVAAQAEGQQGWLHEVAHTSRTTSQVQPRWFHCGRDHRQQKKSGDCKPHPDCESVEQYHVWDTEETREEDETTQEMETHLEVGVSKELMDTFWRTSSQSVHAGGGSVDKPKKPKKEKQDLTEAEQAEQDAKKLLKELGTAIAQSAEWAATVEKSDAIASNLKMSLAHDLTTSKTDLEAGLLLAYMRLRFLR